MDLFEVIHNHRTIRKYKPDPVPDEVINGMLEAGIRASSSGNMQTYSIVVTRDEAIRKQLYQAHGEQSMVIDAPVFITFCADFNRMRKWLALNNAPDNFDDFMSFMVAAIDATLVSQNAALAAEAYGLGICYLGTTLAHCDQVGKILKLPKSVVPVVGFSLGYPDEHPTLRDRLPLDGLVHYETYHEYSDERIQEIYQDRDVKGWERYMSYPRLRKMIEESGVENLAQVYTRLKYTPDFHREISATVLNYLEEQDYLKRTL